MPLALQWLEFALEWEEGEEEVRERGKLGEWGLKA
jgi:hypothetical protein